MTSQAPAQRPHFGEMVLCSERETLVEEEARTRIGAGADTVDAAVGGALAWWALVSEEHVFEYVAIGPGGVGIFLGEARASTSTWDSLYQVQIVKRGVISSITCQGVHPGRAAANAAVGSQVPSSLLGAATDFTNVFGQLPSSAQDFLRHGISGYDEVDAAFGSLYQIHARAKGETARQRLICVILGVGLATVALAEREAVVRTVDLDQTRDELAAVRWQVRCTGWWERGSAPANATTGWWRFA